MKRETTKPEAYSDLIYAAESRWMHRLFIRIFRNSINRVVKVVLARGYERSQIDSHSFHELCGICDRILWPERYFDHLKPDFAGEVRRQMG